MGMDLASLLVLGTGGQHWQILAQQLLSGQPQEKANTQQLFAQQQLDMGQRQALGEQGLGTQALKLLGEQGFGTHVLGTQVLKMLVEKGLGTHVLGTQALKASGGQGLGTQPLKMLEEQGLGTQTFGTQARKALGKQPLHTLQLLQASQLLQVPQLSLQRQVFGKWSSGNLAAFQGDMELAAVLRAMLTKARMGQMRYIRRERLTPLASSTFLTASV